MQLLHLHFSLLFAFALSQGTNSGVAVDWYETWYSSASILPIDLPSAMAGKCQSAKRQKAVAPEPAQVPAVSGDFITDCTNAFNAKRATIPGTNPIRWDTSFDGGKVQQAANYCATSGMSHHMSTVTMGGQILAGGTSCFTTDSNGGMAGPIKMWFDDEIPYNGGHYMIIKTKSNTRFTCAVAGNCIACNFA